MEDGKFLISGRFKDAAWDIEGIPDGSVPVYISKLNADGNTDVTFTGGEGFDDSVEDIAFQQAEGYLWAGGMFKKFEGEDAVTLALFEMEVLSVDEYDMTLFNTYPNPVNDKLYIENADSQGTVTIYDVLGKNVYNAAFNADAVVDMSAFSNGVYIVKLQSGDKAAVQKIIKQ